MNSISQSINENEFDKSFNQRHTFHQHSGGERRKHQLTQFCFGKNKGNRSKRLKLLFYAKTKTKNQTRLRVSQPPLPQLFLNHILQYNATDREKHVWGNPSKMSKFARTKRCHKKDVFRRAANRSQHPKGTEDRPPGL